MENLEIKMSKLDEVANGVYLEVIGEIGAGTALTFSEEIEKNLKKGINKFLIDFAKVSYVNSTGIQILIKLMDTLQEKSGKMSLLCASSKVVVVFDALGLKEYFHFSKEKKDSITYLKS